MSIPHRIAPPGDQHGAVVRELLVRYLDTWTPAALHAARRVTYAATGADRLAIDALRVFGEFADRLAGHHLAMVVAAPTPESARSLTARLAAVHTEVGAPPDLTFHVVAAELVPALTGQAAFGSPVFAYVDGTAVPPEDATLTALGANRGSEVLLTLDPDTAGRSAPALVGHYRALLRDSGLPAVVHVELVDETGRSRLIMFATGKHRHLERFKDELWAVDEFAGVRYRDPRDENGALLDISLAPDVGPLRRAVLRLLADSGPQQVAALRRYVLDETLYRVGDLARLLPGLLASGAVARSPVKGRLAPDTVVRLGRQAGRQ